MKLEPKPYSLKRLFEETPLPVPLDLSILENVLEFAKNKVLCKGCVCGIERWNFVNCECCLTIAINDLKFHYLQFDLTLELEECYGELKKIKRIFQRWLKKAWGLFLDPKDRPPEFWRCLSSKVCDDCGGRRVEERGYYTCEDCFDVGEQVLR
jgi:hypothetical protein